MILLFQKLTERFFPNVTGSPSDVLAMNLSTTSKQYGRHSDLSTTKSFYQSGEKPTDMVDLLNEIDRSNKRLN